MSRLVCNGQSVEFTDRELRTLLAATDVADAIVGSLSNGETEISPRVTARQKLVSLVERGDVEL